MKKSVSTPLLILEDILAIGSMVVCSVLIAAETIKDIILEHTSRRKIHGIEYENDKLKKRLTNLEKDLKELRINNRRCI